MSRISTLARRPATWVVLGAAVILAAAALFWFQPWKLFVDRTVNEALPPLTAPTATATTGTAGATAPTELAHGTFISHEHTTSGTVRVLAGPDGARYLRLDSLDTSDGPLLEVWLTDAAVLAGKDGWYVFDDGQHVSLGPLKGNVGSQNYAIPADLDLARYRSVSIWCARFHVSFGAAELSP